MKGSKNSGNKNMMNDIAGKMLSDDVKRNIKSVLTPLGISEEKITVVGFRDSKDLHTSSMIYVTIPFSLGDETTISIQQHQLMRFEEIGYMFVSIRGKRDEGLLLTLHKMPKLPKNKFTTV